MSHPRDFTLRKLAAFLALGLLGGTTTGLLACSGPRPVPQTIKALLQGLTGGTMNPFAALSPSPSTLPDGGAIGRSRISGILRDAGGQVVPGAQVRVFRELTLAEALVANGAGGLGGGGAVLRRTQSAATEAVADANGRYELEVPAEGNLVLLARAERGQGVLMAHRGGWNARTAATALRDLRMKPPGRLAGRVEVDLPEADLLGLDVFVPGSDFVARTDASGSYEFSQMPEGTYVVVARHPEFGRVGLEGVTVMSGETARARTLVLRPERPVVGEIAGNWYPGEVIRIKGQGFRLAEGKTPQVFLDGLLLPLIGQGTDSLDVRVPSSWTDGQLLVSVDGRASEPVRAPLVQWKFGTLPSHAAGGQRLQLSFEGPASLLRKTSPTFRLGDVMLPVDVSEDSRHLAIPMPPAWVEQSEWRLSTPDGQVATGTVPVRLVKLMVLGYTARGMLAHGPAEQLLKPILETTCTHGEEVISTTGTASFTAAAQDTYGNWLLNPPGITWRVEDAQVPGTLKASVSVDAKGTLEARNAAPGYVTVRAVLGDLSGSDDELAFETCLPQINMLPPEVDLVPPVLKLPPLRLTRTAAADAEAAAPTTEEARGESALPTGYVIYSRPTGLHQILLPERVGEDGWFLTRHFEPPLPDSAAPWSMYGGIASWLGRSTTAPVTFEGTASYPLAGIGPQVETYRLLPRFRVQFLGEGWPMAVDQGTSTNWKAPFPISLSDAAGRVWTLPQVQATRYRNTSRGVDQPRHTWVLPAGTYVLSVTGGSGTATQPVDIGPSGRLEWNEFTVRVPWPG